MFLFKRNIFLTIQPFTEYLRLTTELFQAQPKHAMKLRLLTYPLEPPAEHQDQVSSHQWDAISASQSTSQGPDTQLYPECEKEKTWNKIAKRGITEKIIQINASN